MTSNAIHHKSLTTGPPGVIPCENACDPLCFWLLDIWITRAWQEHAEGRPRYRVLGLYDSCASLWGRTWKNKSALSIVGSRNPKPASSHGTQENIAGIGAGKQSKESRAVLLIQTGAARVLTGSYTYFMSIEKGKCP